MGCAHTTVEPPSDGSSVWVCPPLTPFTHSHESPVSNAHLHDTLAGKPSPPTISPMMCTSGKGPLGFVAAEDAGRPILFLPAPGPLPRRSGGTCWRRSRDLSRGRGGRSPSSGRPRRSSAAGKHKHTHKTTQHNEH